MINAIERLRSLKVTDAMCGAVIQVSASQTMSEAASKFIDHGVSAAPVVDDQGRCVGILSAADFLKRDRASEPDGGWPRMQEHRLVDPDRGDQPLHIAAIPEDMVSAYMTEAVQAIDADASLLKAATVMNQEHIHRLPVIGADGRVIGLVSTMDIVAALLNAIDEMDASFLQQIKHE